MHLFLFLDNDITQSEILTLCLVLKILSDFYFHILNVCYSFLLILNIFFEFLLERFTSQIM